MKTADRMTDFTSFIVMDVMEAAFELERMGIDVVHLEVGEPNFPLPPPVDEAIRKALTDGETHYTHSMGIRPLRVAIAKRYHDKYGVDVSPDRVCVTTGSSAAFLMLMGALVDPGAPVAMSDPGYACYPNFVRFVNGRPVFVPICEEDGFQLTPQVLENSDLQGAETFIISSPANPTGTLTGRATYQWILDRGHNLISDELYHDLRYGDAEQFTALSLSDDAYVVDGFSKRYAMTGCRLGWMVVPEAMVRPVNKLTQNLYISAPAPSQYGGLAALAEGDEYVAQMRDEYQRRHDVLIEGLKKLGFKISFKPQGAFYVFADISNFSDDSYDFCLAMLNEAHVATTPGVDFGTHGTNRYVRFAYTREIEQIEEALTRLERWLITVGC